MVFNLLFIFLHFLFPSIFLLYFLSLTFSHIGKIGTNILNHLKRKDHVILNLELCLVSKKFEITKNEEEKHNKKKRIKNFFYLVIHEKNILRLCLVLQNLRENAN